MWVAASLPTAAAAFFRSKWCVTRTVDPAGRLAAQFCISLDGRPVAALSSLIVFMGSMEGEAGEEEEIGELVERGRFKDTKLPSSNRDRLKQGS
jgi:hypothetical protein